MIAPKKILSTIRLLPKWSFISNTLAPNWFHPFRCFGNPIKHPCTPPSRIEKARFRCIATCCYKQFIFSQVHAFRITIRTENMFLFIGKEICADACVTSKTFHKLHRKHKSPALERSNFVVVYFQTCKMKGATFNLGLRFCWSTSGWGSGAVHDRDDDNNDNNNTDNDGGVTLSPFLACLRGVA